MIIEFRRMAGEHEQFMPYAFDRVIGKSADWLLKETEDGPVLATLGKATLRKAVVADDGRSVLLTVELEEK